MSSFNWRAPPAKKARPDDAGADGANVQGDSGGAARVSGAATRPPADTVHGWALQTHPPAASPLFAGWGVAHIVAVGGAPGGGAPRFASFAAPACGGTPGSAVRPLSSMTPGRVPLTPPVWNRAGDARTPSAADVLRSGTPAGSPWGSPGTSSPWRSMAMGKENDGGNLLSSASTAGARAPAATPGVGRMHSRVRIGDLPHAQLADEVRMMRTQNRALAGELKVVNRLAREQKVAVQQAADAQCRRKRADLQAEHVAEHTELLRELLQLRTQVPADRQELLQLRAQVSALRADLRVFSARGAAWYRRAL